MFLVWSASDYTTGKDKNKIFFNQAVYVNVKPLTGAGMFGKFTNLKRKPQFPQAWITPFKSITTGHLLIDLHYDMLTICGIVTNFVYG